MQRAPKQRSLWLPAFLAVLAFACSLAPSPASSQQWGALDGTWEGSFVSIEGRGLSKPQGAWAPIRVVIDDVKAQVFLLEGGKAQEVKPGAFRISRHGPTAVIYAMDSDSSQTPWSSWVETWVFAVTLKDADTLIANFVRVVNNNDNPPITSESRFSMVSTAELRRAPH